MEAKIYEISLSTEDWGIDAEYRCVLLDVDSSAAAHQIAVRRMKENKADFFLVLFDGQESTPTPDLFDDAVMRECELSYVNIFDEEL